MQAFMEKTKERSKSPLIQVWFTTLHHPLQSHSLHPLTSLYHHFQGLIADPGHVLKRIPVSIGQTSNFDSEEVQDVTDGIAVPANIVDVPAHGMTPCLQAVPSQSLFVPTLHVTGKTYINVRNFDAVMSILIHPLHSNLHLGMTITTNNLHFSTSRTTKTIPPTLTTAPPKSGSLGSLGRTSPSLNITRIPLDGSIAQSHTTNINLMMNSLPSILQSL